MAPNRYWTDDDAEYLADHYGRRADASIAAHLGRSLWSIRLKAKRLGINHKSNVWSSRDVARLFGIDGKTVATWIRRGWIKARRAPFGCGANRPWSVDADSLERFVRGMGWAYDWRLMTEGEYLTNIARDLHKADPWLTVPEIARELGWHPGTVQRHVQSGSLPCQRRPKHTHGGPREGAIVVQRSALLAWREQYAAESHRRRSASATQRNTQRSRTNRETEKAA